MSAKEYKTSTLVSEIRSRGIAVMLKAAEKYFDEHHDELE